MHSGASSTLRALGPFIAAGVIFAACLAAGEFAPEIRREAFCRPAAALASVFLGVPAIPDGEGWTLPHPAIEVNVVAACSGYDFFAILLASLCGIALNQGARAGLLFLLPLSYGVALVANSARIVCAVQARLLTGLMPIGLPDASVHLAVGAAIFATLLAASCRAVHFVYELDIIRRSTR